MKGILRVFPDEHKMAAAAMLKWSGIAVEAVSLRKSCTMVLAGGSTPRALYRLAATADPALFPWASTHVFLGDERFVPEESPESNYRMIRETLLSHVPLSPSNIHRIYTEAGDPQKAAIAYAGELASVFAPDRVPRFDIVLLGIGSDGHTASLFPGSPALASTGTVEAVHAPVDGRVRITLTLRVINNARTVLVLVSGREKAKVLHEVMSSGEESPVLPAAMVKPENGELYWFVSADAATLLTDSK